jgi:hypothetical protein
MLPFDVSALSANAPTSARELDLVHEEIDRVIKLIQDEQDALLPVAFAFGALVQPASFGQPDSAPKLAHHYSRAHDVTWKTLNGVKEDLIKFRDACTEARKAIVTADETAADDMRVISNALTIVAAGGRGDETNRAHREARQGQNTAMQDTEGSAG